MLAKSREKPSQKKDRKKISRITGKIASKLRESRQISQGSYKNWKTLGYKAWNHNKLNAEKCAPKAGNLFIQSRESHPQTGKTYLKPGKHDLRVRKNQPKAVKRVLNPVKRIPVVETGETETEAKETGFERLVLKHP